MKEQNTHNSFRKVRNGATGFALCSFWCRDFQLRKQIKRQKTAEGENAAGGIINNNKNINN